MDDKTTVAIVGGTGSLGTGVARRLARPGIRVIIGSRDLARARQAAETLNARLGRPLVDGKLNADAVREAEIVVVAVPYEGHKSMIADLSAELRGKLVVDAVVPLRQGRPFIPEAGSALLEAQQILGAETPVIGALHNISAVDLQEIDAPLGDVLVCGDSEAAKQRVIDLLGKIGARAFDAGPAANAYIIEGITGVLIQLNRKYKSKHATLKVVGI
ncbi:MAG TPA: NADPH-dependent F420 reductase [Candidatus Acidoferrales bacterium]|nr:NADPH-dependent F420 reductase [Candidatus Acidoferrales bacterium]